MQMRVEEVSPFSLMLLAQYIGNNNLHVPTWWGRISQATTLTPIGSLLGENWAIYHMGSPNSSPSATRLWLVLYDLVDAHTRIDIIQLKP